MFCWCPTSLKTSVIFACLHAAHYYRARSLSFDALFKYTNRKLELSSDDMLLIFENGNRGGLV
ncbi:C2H2-type domain-containing protein [Aphis craccivora]|uniref:C2H2-type domain-containing protein n=1 Tax=Aphis craccivora TaxID=307492 RepID=A0A6G0W4J6_APHCR|nr:C2H2-type domain-containing protein [Aphis craccivora]